MKYPYERLEGALSAESLSFAIVRACAAPRRSKHATRPACVAAAARIPPALTARAPAPAPRRRAQVVGRFNDIVTRPLLEGALSTIQRHGARARSAPAAAAALRAPCAAPGRHLTATLRLPLGTGGDVEGTTVVWVPGSFEIPLVAKRLASSGQYDAVITLGAVVRGSTTHYDAVAGAAANGCLTAGLSTGVPIIFGVLTCETMEQAMDRAGGKLGNKGGEVTLTAIEMANLFRTLPEAQAGGVAAGAAGGAGGAGGGWGGAAQQGAR